MCGHTTNASRPTGISISRSAQTNADDRDGAEEERENADASLADKDASSRARRMRIAWLEMSHRRNIVGPSRLSEIRHLASIVACADFCTYARADPSGCATSVPCATSLEIDIF